MLLFMDAAPRVLPLLHLVSVHPKLCDVQSFTKQPCQEMTETRKISGISIRAECEMVLGLEPPVLGSADVLNSAMFDHATLLS
jgi:hypothetical protein